MKVTTSLSIKNITVDKDNNIRKRRSKTFRCRIEDNNSDRLHYDILNNYYIGGRHKLIVLMDIPDDIVNIHRLVGINNPGNNYISIMYLDKSWILDIINIDELANHSLITIDNHVDNLFILPYISEAKDILLYTLLKQKPYIHKDTTLKLLECFLDKYKNTYKGPVGFLDNLISTIEQCKYDVLDMGTISKIYTRCVVNEYLNNRGVVRTI